MYAIYPRKESSGAAGFVNLHYVISAGFLDSIKYYIKFIIIRFVGVFILLYLTFVLARLAYHWSSLNYILNRAIICKIIIGTMVMVGNPASCVF
jgi:hypothetical protein